MHRSPNHDAPGLRWLSQGEADPPTEPGWLSPREAERANGMRFRKRRDEFRLGRWTAKLALATALGLPTAPPSRLGRLEIGHAPDGAPAPHIDGAPAPLSISMTDRAGWAICLVGPPSASLGVDLELVEPRSAAFVADYLTAAEQAQVSGATTDEMAHLLANLIWSAKESALKVLRTGLRRDTRSVEVSFPPEEGCDGWSALLVTSAEGRRFFGWWQRMGSFLLTAASSVPLPPPTSLQEPPGLARAVPTHSWWPPA